MQKAIRLFSRLTEGVAALMMAAMFLTFMLQIAVRYLFGAPWFVGIFGNVDQSAFSWTLEFCLVLWLWLVFWGNSFVVRDRDHVTFDIVYLGVRPAVRRWFAIISAIVIAVVLAWSWLPTLDKMWILRLKNSATLPTKMLPLYSIYFVFLTVVPLRYLWRAYDVYRNGAEGEGHHHLEVTDE